MATVVVLPSGRTVELHEPTFGEELAIVAAGHNDLAELMYAKAALIAGIGREELAAMKREDGRALVIAVGRVWDGRPEEQEAPFENGSDSRSMASSRKKTTRKAATS